MAGSAPRKDFGPIGSKRKSGNESSIGSKEKNEEEASGLIFSWTSDYIGLGGSLLERRLRGMGLVASLPAVPAFLSRSHATTSYPLALPNFDRNLSQENGKAGGLVHSLPEVRGFPARSQAEVPHPSNLPDVNDNLSQGNDMVSGNFNDVMDISAKYGYSIGSTRPGLNYKRANGKYFRSFDKNRPK